uniref:Transmembrane protein 238 n=1 Tax=Denticeps clupeoides TaxID=299321 RepID=A0AAY4DT46_9TELE
MFSTQVVETGSGPVQVYLAGRRQVAAAGGKTTGCRKRTGKKGERERERERERRLSHDSVPADKTYYRAAMATCTGLSHCKLALSFAVIMDLFGVAALLVGVFAHLEINGRDFGDLLVYTGALLVLMSLGGWVVWYSGNIEGITTQKEMGHIGNMVDRLARNLSRKINRNQRVQKGP